MPTNYQGEPKKEKKAAEIEPKVVEKIVTTDVIVKKKSIRRRFKEVFFGGDFKSAVRFVAADVLLPALRNMVADSGKAAIDRAIYGETRSQRRDPNYRSFVQYNNPVSRNVTYSHLPDQPRYYPQAQTRPIRPDDTQLVIVNRAEAESVVERMIDYADKYDVATVADLKGLIGEVPNNVDHKWGWTSLSTAQIRQVREGYLIDLPPAEPIQ